MGKFQNIGVESCEKIECPNRESGWWLFYLFLSFLLFSSLSLSLSLSLVKAVEEVTAVHEESKCLLCLSL